MMRGETCKPHPDGRGCPAGRSTFALLGASARFSPDVQGRLLRPHPLDQFLHSSVRLQPVTTFQGALPYDCNPPPQLPQCGLCEFVIRAVSADLLRPEFFARRRPFEEVAIVLMPETAVYKNDCAVPGQDNIRFPGQVLCVEFETKTGRME